MAQLISDSARTEPLLVERVATVLRYVCGTTHSKPVPARIRR